MPFEDHQMPNLGVFKYTFSDEQFIPIHNEVNKIQQNNFVNLKNWNNRLAGNIEKEFLLDGEIKRYIESLITPYCKEYDNIYNYTKNYYGILNQDVPIQLSKLWINFQTKHEFNPVHAHSGIFSFVIWVDIPYDIQDELQHSSSKQSNCPFPGHFEFIYNNILGRTVCFQLPVDKSFNKTMVLFPSTLSHTVYPFFTSDEYRISISGNFTFNIG